MAFPVTVHCRPAAGPLSLDRALRGFSRGEPMMTKKVSGVTVALIAVVGVEATRFVEETK